MVVFLQRNIMVISVHIAGIGAHDGFSMIVRYQAEITQLQDMLKESKSRVEDIERYPFV